MASGFFGKASHGLTTFYQRMRDHGYWVASAGKLNLVRTGASGPHGEPPGAFILGFAHPYDWDLLAPYKG